MADNPFTLPPQPDFVPFDPRELSRHHRVLGVVRAQPYAPDGPKEQLLTVKLTAIPSPLTSAHREFKDVVSVKFEDQWLRIFSKTGDYTFPRKRVIEVETIKQS